MIQNIITAFFLGMTLSTTISAAAEIAYNLKSKAKTMPSTWIAPGIFAAAFWFCWHL